jgi:hypothetical protein
MRPFGRGAGASGAPSNSMTRRDIPTRDTQAFSVIHVFLLLDLGEAEKKILT